MINFNGTLVEGETKLFSNDNRGFKYGDGLFETLKIANNNILFWEDHYFRLMASMRILRMEIPMSFTMEFLQAEIIKTVVANNFTNARVRLDVYRGDGGKYLPNSKEIGYSIATSKLDHSDFKEFDLNPIYRVDLFKDYYVNTGLLSTLKSTDKLINILGSIYAEENGLQNCLLLNSDKSVIEATNSNLFMVKENTIKTPPLMDGCLKGIMRQQLIDLIQKKTEFVLVEKSISSFELQKADELFLTNVIWGIKSITDYRKKNFAFKVANDLRSKLNNEIRNLLAN